MRLVTCGSVDDGKSTLIGRLLYDTKQIFVDQLEHIEDVSRRRGNEYVDLALLTDGLRAEREQGITIDVAYRSFVTPRRRFQLADAPGHVQYTRNMVTGASTAELGIVLVDARQGVVEQTRRHAYILSILARPARRRRGQQDGSRRLVAGAVRRDRRAQLARARAAATCARSRSRRLQGDNVVDRSRAHAVVRRPGAARASRDGRDRLRPRPRQPALPGAVGDPADVGRAPRLPRLRRPGRRRGLERGRRRGRPARRG